MINQIDKCCKCRAIFSPFSYMCNKCQEDYMRKNPAHHGILEKNNPKVRFIHEMPIRVILGDEVYRPVDCISEFHSKEDIEFDIHVSMGTRYLMNDFMVMPLIKNVIFNPPATIVFFEDGTKTVVKTQEGDTYDPEKGLAMAISKRLLGNDHKYYWTFKKWLKRARKSTPKDDA